MLFWLIKKLGKLFVFVSMLLVLLIVGLTVIPSVFKYELSIKKIRVFWNDLVVNDWYVNL